MTPEERRTIKRLVDRARRKRAAREAALERAEARHPLSWEERQERKNEHGRRRRAA